MRLHGAVTASTCKYRDRGFDSCSELIDISYFDFIHLVRENVYILNIGVKRKECFDTMLFLPIICNKKKRKN